MKTDAELQAEVKGMLKAVMKRRGRTSNQLAATIAEIGVKADSPVLRNKVVRGGFSAVFLVPCLKALSAKEVRISRHL